MDTTFDEKLDRMEKSQNMSFSFGGGDTVLEGYPTWRDVKGAAVFVTDTLDLCWVAAKSIFGEQATPEHALAIYDRMQQRLEEVGMQECEDDADEDDEDEE